MLTSNAPPAVPGAVARPPRFSREAFRARIALDPRPWVLALAAAEGLVGFCVSYDGKVETPGPGYLLLVGVGFATVAPAAAVLLLYVQGRVLWWAGKLLRGRATPAELRAAAAWSQVPVLAVGWPAVLHLAARVAIAESEPVPAPLAFAGDLLRALAGWASTLAAIAGVLGAVLFVGYVAEAEGFTGRRALASHVLALVVSILVLGAGGALGWALYRALA